MASVLNWLNKQMRSVDSPLHVQNIRAYFGPPEQYVALPCKWTSNGHNTLSEKYCKMFHLALGWHLSNGLVRKILTCWNKIPNCVKVCSKLHSCFVPDKNIDLFHLRIYEFNFSYRRIVGVFGSCLDAAVGDQLCPGAKRIDFMMFCLSAEEWSRIN